MIELIYNNYNIYIDKIFFENNKHFFFINNYKIYIIKCSEEDYKKMKNLIIITNELYNSICVNTFILNNKMDYLTKYNEEYIALCRVNNIENDFNVNDIYKFWNLNTNLEEYDILNIWKNEIDDLEKKLIMINNEFSIIQESVNYYIGMAENAIQLLNNYKNIIKNNNDSIGHMLSYRLFDGNSIFDPFTFIKINKMYDISNYIKYKFLKNEIDYNEIESFFINGNDYENIFLFSNLLYPSVYLDLIKRIIDEDEEEIKIQSLIRKRKIYNKLLSFCKKIVKNDKNIKLINWFE